MSSSRHFSLASNFDSDDDDFIVNPVRPTSHRNHNNSTPSTHRHVRERPDKLPRTKRITPSRTHSCSRSRCSDDNISSRPQKRRCTEPTRGHERTMRQPVATKDESSEERSLSPVLHSRRAQCEHESTKDNSFDVGRIPRLQISSDTKHDDNTFRSQHTHNQNDTNFGNNGSNNHNTDIADNPSGVDGDAVVHFAESTVGAAPQLNLTTDHAETSSTCLPSLLRGTVPQLSEAKPLPPYNTYGWDPVAYTGIMTQWYAAMYAGWVEAHNTQRYQNNIMMPNLNSLNTTGTPIPPPQEEASIQRTSRTPENSVENPVYVNGNAVSHLYRLVQCLKVKDLNIEFSGEGSESNRTWTCQITGTYTDNNEPQAIEARSTGKSRKLAKRGASEEFLRSIGK